MKHKVVDNTIECSNCHHRMFPVVDTDENVFVCLREDCGWITGPDFVVQRYLKDLK